MGVVPEKPAERVTFYLNHATTWNGSASQIGTTVADVADLQTKATAARAALDSQQAARQAAKTATENARNAVAAMSIAGASILKEIRATGERTGDPNVYVLADIPAPALPAPTPPPGTPSNLSVTLDGNGALLLKWKCSNPRGASGTIYQIWRRDSPTSELNYLGGVGSKKYTDGTIPAGATQITYQIQAVRSTAKGLWATFNVNFGTGTAGATTASVTDAKAA